MKPKNLLGVVFYLLLVGVNVQGMQNTIKDSEKKKNIEISVVGLYPDDTVHVRFIVDNNDEIQQSHPLSNQSPIFLFEYVNLKQKYKILLESYITYTPPEPKRENLPSRNFELEDVYYCEISPNKNTLTREEKSYAQTTITDKVEIKCTKKLWPDMMLIYRHLRYAPFRFEQNHILRLIFTYLYYQPHVEFACPKFEPTNFRLSALAFLPKMTDWIVSINNDSNSSDQGNILLWNYKGMCLRIVSIDEKYSNIQSLSLLDRYEMSRVTNITNVCFSISGRYMAIHLSTGEVKIWNMTTGAQHKIPQKFSEITQLRFVDSTSLLVAGKSSFKCFLGLWNVQTEHWGKKLEFNDKIHDYILSSVTTRSENNERIITFTLVHGHVQKPDPESSDEMYFQESNSESNDEMNLPDYEIPILRRMAEIDNTVDHYSMSLHRWNMETNTVTDVKTFPDFIKTPMISEDGTLVVLQETATSQWWLWDMTSSDPDHRIMLDQCPIYISAQHKLLIFDSNINGRSDHRLLIKYFNTDTQEITSVQEIFTLGLGGRVGKVTISSDGQTIAVTSEKHSEIFFYDINTGKQIKFLIIHERGGEKRIKNITLQ